jgi:hypothetical protein
LLTMKTDRQPSKQWFARIWTLVNKLDTVSDVQFGEMHCGRIEMAYYLMATACGIEMMESRLMEENGRAHFMTKAFLIVKVDQRNTI